MQSFEENSGFASSLSEITTLLSSPSLMGLRKAEHSTGLIAKCSLGSRSVTGRNDQFRGGGFNPQGWEGRCSRWWTHLWWTTFLWHSFGVWRSLWTRSECYCHSVLCIDSINWYIDWCLVYSVGLWTLSLRYLCLLELWQPSTSTSFAVLFWNNRSWQLLINDTYGKSKWRWNAILTNWYAFW